MVTPTHVQNGDVITPDSVFANQSDTSLYNFVKLADDGSRLVLAHTTLQPRNFHRYPEEFQQHLDQIDGGPGVLWGLNAAVNWWDATPGKYLPYTTNLALPVTAPLAASDTPVNAKPYVVRWKRHLSDIANQWVTTHADDIFDHETKLTGFSPASVSLNAAQTKKHEVCSLAVRRAIGVLFGKAEVVDLIDAVATPEWPTIVATIGGLIQTFCDSCAGRGFKREILRYIDADAWAARYSVDGAGVYFIDRTNPTAWGIGAAITRDQGEATNAISNFVRALKYHEQTSGEEDIHILPGD